MVRQRLIPAVKTAGRPCAVPVIERRSVLGADSIEQGLGDRRPAGFVAGQEGAGVPDGLQAQRGRVEQRLAGLRMRVKGRQLANHVRRNEHIRRFVGGLADWFERSGFSEGCPVTSVVAATVPQSRPHAETAQAIFEDWQRRLSAHASRLGTSLSPADAELPLMLVEGAWI